jgi:hypothetical protein
MRADLRHQEDRLAPIGDGAPHAPLALALVILPGVVEEVDAVIDRLVDDAHSLGHRWRLTQVVAAEAEDGDEISVTPKGTPGNLRASREPAGHVTSSSEAPTTCRMDVAPGRGTASACGGGTQEWHHPAVRLDRSWNSRA